MFSSDVDVAMALLTGMTEDGQEVPVQVKPDGKLVAEGLPGPTGPQGIQGAPGPQGPQGVQGVPGVTTLPAPLYVADGKVGIGTSSPLFGMHQYGVGSSFLIESSTGDSGQVRFKNTSGYISTGLSGAGGNVYLIYDGLNSRTAYEYNGLAGGDNHVWYTGKTARLSITSDGKVGIGAPTPSSPLTVESSSDDQVKVTRTNIASYFLSVLSNQDLRVHKDGAERLRITANGIIRIASVPVYADNAAAKADGLTAGDVYRTSMGQLMIAF